MRLIDADALQKDIHENEYILSDDYNIREMGMFTGGIDFVIELAETIDAIEVVRCGKCEYWGDDLNCPMCNYCRPELKPKEDFFCKSGKRKAE